MGGGRNMMKRQQESQALTASSAYLFIYFKIAFRFSFPRALQFNPRAKVSLSTQFFLLMFLVYTSALQGKG